MIKVPSPFKSSLRRELIALMLVCSFVALSLSLLVSYFGAQYLLKRALLKTHETITYTLANNSKTAVISNKAEIASKALAFLDNYPNIDLACLYNYSASAKVIGNAFFSPNAPPDYNISQSQCPEVNERQSSYFTSEHMHAFAPIKEQNITIGTAYIRAKSAHYNQLSLKLLLLITATFVVTSVIVFFIARLLQQTISKPMAELNEILSTIISQRVYTSHFVFERQDEIGSLAEKIKKLLQTLSKAHTELRDTSYTDHITGLPNSRFFLNDMKKHISSLKRSHNSMAVLIIDIDGLSDLYRSQGEKIGDLAWTTVAKRLKECIRSEQTVARLSESVFATVQEKTDESWRIRSFCDRIFSCIEEPIHCEGKNFTVTASIGIALTDNHRHNPASLIESAQQAMHLARKQSGNSLYFQDNDMQAETKKLQTLTADFARLIEKSKITLYAKPIYKLNTKAVAGFDLLPFVTLVGKPPFDYSDAAQRFEDKGSINQYHKWFIRKLKADLQAHGSAFYGDMEIITWRTTIKHIYSATFLDTMLTAGKLFDVYGIKFLVAIPEAAALALDSTHKRMLGHKLAQSNVAFAVDIAYNSTLPLLTHADGLPIELFRFNLAKDDLKNASKIDKFFNDVTLKMTRLKGINCAAMNITTSAQIDMFTESQCTYGQGVYFASPVSLGQVQDFLNHPPAPGAILATLNQ